VGLIIPDRFGLRGNIKTNKPLRGQRLLGGMQRLQVHVEGSLLMRLLLTTEHME